MVDAETSFAGTVVSSQSRKKGRNDYSELQSLLLHTRNQADVTVRKYLLVMVI